MRFFVFIFIFFSSLASASLKESLQPEYSYLNDPQVTEFINYMNKKHKFNSLYLSSIFAKSKRDDGILKTIKRPAEGGRLTWEEYRAIFITKKRIQGGKNLLKKYRTVLKLLEKKYGVPPAIIVAIVGVETFYGKHTGKHRVFEALATIAFNYPKRHKFFTAELENLLLFARKYKRNPYSLYGSYAGAMGLPQFMPSSYLRHARSYKENQFADIWNRPQDAFASIGNYLKHYGWEKNQDTFLVATTKNPIIPEKRTTKPYISYKELKQKGWKTKRKIPNYIKNKTLLNPITLIYKNKNLNLLGLNNLRVIARYNPSLYYTLAVSILANKIAH